MLPAARRRNTWAIVASAIVHLAVVLVVLAQRPTLVIPPSESGPPEPIIPILIMPRTPPPPSANGRLVRPAPIRLHRRPQPFLPSDVPTAPIAPPEPPAAPAAPPAPRGPVALHPSPLPEGPKGDVRTALRQGPVGCANPLAAGLNRAERDHCSEVFGKGAKDAAFAGLGLSAAKQKLLEAAGAAREADYRYKHSQAPGALPDTARPGETAEDMARTSGTDHPKATIPY
jgi:hypothetical protein